MPFSRFVPLYVWSPFASTRCPSHGGYLWSALGGRESDFGSLSPIPRVTGGSGCHVSGGSSSFHYTLSFLSVAGVSLHVHATKSQRLQFGDLKPNPKWLCVLTVFSNSFPPVDTYPHAHLPPPLPPQYFTPGSPFSHYTLGWAGTRFSASMFPPPPTRRHPPNPRPFSPITEIKS